MTIALRPATGQTSPNGNEPHGAAATHESHRRQRARGAAVTIEALCPLLDKLARCRSDTDVSGVAMDAVKGTFACHIGATILLDESLAATDRAFFGVRQGDVEDYEDHWRPMERVFPAVMARAVPVHNWQVYTEDEWQRDRVWLGYGRRHRIYHYMSAPIFGSRGRLIGVFNLCRPPNGCRFDAKAVDMAGVFSGFLSATLARVSGAVPVIGDQAPDSLAPREIQVARLAAAGRNNVEIALALGIARETVKQTLGRVYRKLDVTGRAQMAATLTARGWVQT
jgi:DNA-binding CsgD family transcriptional regulator